MDDSKSGSIKEMPLGLDATMEEEYASQSKLLQEFASISNIDKAWIFKSNGGMASHFIAFLFSNVWYFFPPSQHSRQELLAIIFALKTFAAGIGSQAMFSISQANLLANKRRKCIVSAHISQETKGTVSFQWAPFPVEMTGVSTIVPSPSGSKLLVLRNPENESPSKFEIWGSSQLEKEFHIPQSVHGSVYTDGW